MIRGAMHVPSWFHLTDIVSATAVGLEIAFVGAIIAALQLWYSRSRDHAVDKRNDWEKIHKAIIEFRVRREFLNNRFPGITSVEQWPSAINAYQALSQLKGQLDRVGDPLAADIAKYLDQNWEPGKWQAPEFVPKFDEFAGQVALRSRDTPPAMKTLKFAFTICGSIVAGTLVLYSVYDYAVYLGFLQGLKVCGR